MSDMKPLHDLGALDRIGWLSEQPAGFQARIAAAGRWVSLTRGEELYTVGDEPTALFGLEEGHLDLSIPIGRNELVAIHRAGPGFWIGDSALLATGRRTLNLTAASPSRVFRVPAGAVRQLLADHPEGWACFARLAHLNGTLAVQVLAEVLALPPRARFARMLLRMAGPDGTVRATQEELGALAGMSRAAFRRAFGALIQAGVVRTEYGGLRIIDMAALHAETDRD